MFYTREFPTFSFDLKVCDTELHILLRWVVRLKKQSLAQTLAERKKHYITILKEKLTNAHSCQIMLSDELDGRVVAVPGTKTGW